MMINFWKPGLLRCLCVLAIGLCFYVGVDANVAQLKQRCAELLNVQECDAREIE